MDFEVVDFGVLPSVAVHLYIMPDLTARPSPYIEGDEAAKTLAEYRTETVSWIYGFPPGENTVVSE